MIVSLFIFHKIFISVTSNLPHCFLVAVHNVGPYKIVRKKVENLMIIFMKAVGGNSASVYISCPQLSLHLHCYIVTKLSSVPLTTSNLQVLDNNVHSKLSYFSVSIIHTFVQTQHISHAGHYFV